MEKFILCGLFAVLMVILTVPQGALGIKCWVCNSELDPRCLDTFDNSTFAITDCKYMEAMQDQVRPAQKLTMCRKSYYNVKGTWHYVRGCSARPESHNNLNDQSFCTGKNDNFTENCYCENKDGCNHSGKLGSAFHLIAGVVLVGIILAVKS